MAETVIDGISNFAGISKLGCRPVAIENGEVGQVTGITATGEPGWLDVHPEAVLTNDDAPFAWDVATQTGNIPQAGQVTVDGGTVTFDPGDGSSPVAWNICDLLANCEISALGNVDAPAPGLGDIVQWNGTNWTNQPLPTEIFVDSFDYDAATGDLLITLNDPGNTTFTVNLLSLIPVTVDSVTITGTGQPGNPLVAVPTVLTTSDAPFSWDAATQTGNIPLPGQLSVAGSVVTFDPGDGSAVVDVDICALLANCNINALGNVNVAPGVGDNLNWNGTEWIAAAPGTEIYVNGLVFDPVTGELSITLNDAANTSYSVNIPLTHPAVTLTNNAAPFSWDGATQAGNIPQVGRLVANADGSFTFTPGDGSAAVTIPAPAASVETALVATDSDTIDFTTSGTNGHNVTGMVKVDPDPCNRLVANANGLFVQDVHHVMFSINEAAQMGVPAWSSGDIGSLPTGTDVTPLTGTLTLNNPSHCLEMDFVINGMVHATMDNGIDNQTAAWDRTIVLLELDSGGGVEWISGHSASRQTTTGAGGLALGENTQPYSREHHVTVPAGGTLNIPWGMRVIVANGLSAGTQVWLPSFSVVGIAS